MNSTSFISAEGTESNQDSGRILARFLGSLSLLKWISPVALLLIIAATASPQLFLWLTGEYSQCSDLTRCSVQMPFVGQLFGLTPKLLALIALGAALLRLGSWALFEIAGQWATQTIHQRMVAAVARTRTTFFDENPSGRLINRLVRDFDNLRTTGIVRISDMVYAITETLCVSALVFLAHPIGALLIIPTLVIFFYAQGQISPMLQRCATLKSARFSEVLHRETDIIEGARTFQLYGKQAALLQRLRDALAQFIQINLVRAEVEAWGRFWTMMVTTIYAFSALAVVGTAVHSGSISPPLGAVIITVIFRLSPVISWLTWSTSYLIESIATARRVFEYVDLAEETQEELAAAVYRQTVPQLGQESSGDIEFTKFTMSYRPGLPQILKDLSLKLPQGKRIGIVGRTGSGKTTLLQSLFRMVYVHSGDIRVGGRSIFSLPIGEVRSLFSVVPQDPYLFEGTVRSNLDRRNSFRSSVLEHALQSVGLPLALDTKISEGGKNLSLGERQLLCLARVLVMNRPYILMDEPTSSVDMLTDQKIQEVLTHQLFGKTVITVAHRLQTLGTYDLIVELRNGRVARMGSPTTVLPMLTEADIA